MHRGLACALATALVAVFAAPAATAVGADRVDVLVRYASPTTSADLAVLERAGARVEHRYGIVPAVAASVPERALDGLRRSPRIAGIEPDHRVEGLDYRPTHDWGIAHIGADAVHAAGNLGVPTAAPPVRVAVLDSGVDCDHAELSGTACKAGQNFIADPPTTQTDDDWGHGTHVAGTVFARRDVVDGAALTGGVVGVAPGAEVVAYKVLDDQGYGSISDVIAAVDHVWNGGALTAQVINVSLGWGSGSTTFQATMDRAYAAGIVLVAAAGNGGQCSGKGSNVSYPARYATVLAVAAVDQANARACWSATGDQLDLSAPGVRVYSTWPADLATSPRDPQPVCEGAVCHYKYGSGTSMSAPHVAGAAALVLASGTVADGDGVNGVADEVYDRLRATADALGPATQYGHGLVDAYEATRAPETSEPPAAGGISLSVSGYKHRGTKHVDLAWTGATTTVDVVRDGVVVARDEENDGAYHDHPPKESDSHVYRVCEAGTTTCSPDAAIAF